MRKLFRIGRAAIAMELPEEIALPETLKAFEVPEAKTGQEFCVSFVPNPEEAERHFCRVEEEVRVYTRPHMRVLVSGEKECRIVWLEGDERPYAAYRDVAPGRAEVLFRPDIEPLLMYETIFLSPFCLEKYMLAADMLVFHSAYLLHDGGAILFTAPSGTGKSTQAGLWEKYRGGRTINGDKSLLMRESVWKACGWPVCGSSQICYNESHPIRAIVYLSQAKENAIRRLSLAEAVKKLYTQITVNMWNPDAQMHAMDLLVQLAGEVPVYALACDISQEAVACLEGVL